MKHSELGEARQNEESTTVTNYESGVQKFNNSLMKYCVCMYVLVVCYRNFSTTSRFVLPMETATFGDLVKYGPYFATLR